MSTSKPLLAMSEVEMQLGLIRALLYRTITVNDPMDQVDHVIKNIIGRNVLGANAEEYLQAIRAVLASDMHLSELVSPYHSEEAVRRFLTEVQNRLQDES